jgi:hypothetical protein
LGLLRRRYGDHGRGAAAHRDPSGRGPAVGPELVRLAGFDRLVSDFTTRLCATKTAKRAEKLAETAGDGLGTIDPADDRPLYWARLRMSKAHPATRHGRTSSRSRARRCSETGG